jgi:hypothetical protein
LKAKRALLLVLPALGVTACGGGTSPKFPTPTPSPVGDVRNSAQDPANIRDVERRIAKRVRDAGGTNVTAHCRDDDMTHMTCLVQADDADAHQSETWNVTVNPTTGELRAIPDPKTLITIDKPPSAADASPSSTPEPTGPYLRYDDGRVLEGQALVDYCDSQAQIRQDYRDAYKSSFSTVEPEMAQVDDVCRSIGH